MIYTTSETWSRSRGPCGQHLSDKIRVRKLNPFSSQTVQSIPSFYSVSHDGHIWQTESRVFLFERIVAHLPDI